MPAVRDALDSILALDRGVGSSELLLGQLAEAVLATSGCTLVSLGLRSGATLLLASRPGRATATLRVDSPRVQAAVAAVDGCDDAGLSPRDLELLLLTTGWRCAGPSTGPAGSAWTDGREPLQLVDPERGLALRCALAGEATGHAVAVLPFAIDQASRGLLLLGSAEPGRFDADRVAGHEAIARALGILIAHRAARTELRDRDHGLACLARIADLCAEPELSAHAILKESVAVLGPAWRHPELASARVVLDGITFISPAFQEPLQSMRAEIVVDGASRGLVEVGYAQERPPADDGPFTRHERHLLDLVARLLALAVKQHGGEQARQDLEDQLRHADRLATIGQLSAGVAHELNEPLAAILGFAQLTLKERDLPERVRSDLDKIVTAALHGREVVHKLMLFAHQAPPQKTWVGLNSIARDGLYFLESRCAKAGIELRRELDPELPEIHADPGQMYQIMVNLTVNAIQAMPDGGRLTIATAQQDGDVVLTVADTGTGMTDQVRAKVFVPFFTTKDVGEGTGLGLAVVDGIVKSHGGSVDVDSVLHVGTTFRVRLPLEHDAPDAEQ